MCRVLEANLAKKFAADLSLQIFLIHCIFTYGYDEAFFSLKKFSRIGACIRCNFTP